MPISVKSSLNGLAAIKHVDIDEELYDWLHYSGFQVKLTAAQLEFRHPDFPPNAQVVGKVPVTMSKLHQLQQGTLNAEEMAEMQVLIEDVVKALMAYDPQPQKSGVAKSALAMLPKSKPQAPTPSKWPVFDKAKMKTNTTVPLTAATSLYQPVTGTSAGSRYFLVAASDALRIAARWRPNHNTLSIRVEGTKFTALASNISEAGFDHKNGYASLHLSCDTEVVARKALGAVLAGLSIPIDTPMPDIALIAEK